jgi:heme/copper-type cytochrome/quinol oxidase subunit 2
LVNGHLLDACQSSTVFSKEAKMNNTEISQTEVVEKKVEKKKRSAWDIFVTFMAMGGFLVVMVVGVVILVFVYWLTK